MSFGEQSLTFDELLRKSIQISALLWKPSEPLLDLIPESDVCVVVKRYDIYGVVIARLVLIDKKFTIFWKWSLNLSEEQEIQGIRDKSEKNRKSDRRHADWGSAINALLVKSAEEDSTKR